MSHPYTTDPRHVQIPRRTRSPSTRQYDARTDALHEPSIIRPYGAPFDDAAGSPNEGDSKRRNGKEGDQIGANPPQPPKQKIPNHPSLRPKNPRSWSQVREAMAELIKYLGECAQICNGKDPRRAMEYTVLLVLAQDTRDWERLRIRGIIHGALSPEMNSYILDRRQWDDGYDAADDDEQGAFRYTTLIALIEKLEDLRDLIRIKIREELPASMKRAVETHLTDMAKNKTSRNNINRADERLGHARDWTDQRPADRVSNAASDDPRRSSAASLRREPTTESAYSSLPVPTTYAAQSPSYAFRPGPARVESMPQVPRQLPEGRDLDSYQSPRNSRGTLGQDSYSRKSMRVDQDR